MAGGKPFRVNDSPRKGGTGDGEKASPWPGKAIVQARRDTGGPLPTNQDITDADRHGHSPIKPLPPVKNDPKPFKNTK